MTKIIYQNPETGRASIVTPAPGYTIEDAKKAVPSGVSYEIVEDSVIPSDRTFRNAWIKDGSTIKEDLTKSKVIGHEKRRVERAKEFKPYDDKVALNISSSEVTAAEAERAKIRTKYATMQTNIDNATDIAGIKTALGG